MFLVRNGQSEQNIFKIKRQAKNKKNKTKQKTNKKKKQKKKQQKKNMSFRVMLKGQ